MTHRRVVSVVILMWMLTVFIFFMIWWGSFDIIRSVVVILAVVCLLVTGLVYFRIYLAVQRLRKLNQIHALQVPQATGNNEIWPTSLNLHLVAPCKVIRNPESR